MTRDTIFVTGWRGPTGNAIVRALAAKYPDTRFVGLTRATTRPDAPDADVVARIESEEIADLNNAAEVAAAFARHGKRIRLVAHVAHITFSPVILRQSEQFGIPHTVCVHTTGIHSRYPQFTEGYRNIEAQVFGVSPLHVPWTIVRPTMIYGTPRDRNMHTLVLRIAARKPLPLFIGAQGRMQPVHVDDLASGVAGAAENPATFGRAYDLSGGSIVTYRESIDIIGRELGIKPVLIPVPVGLALPLTRLVERRGKRFPVTEEQILRLLEDKCYDHGDAVRDLGYAPRSFTEGIRQEIGLMRSTGILTG